MRGKNSIHMYKRGGRLPMYEQLAGSCVATHKAVNIHGRTNGDPRAVVMVIDRNVVLKHSRTNRGIVRRAAVPSVGGARGYMYPL